MTSRDGKNDASVLLIIDMINDFGFTDGDTLAAEAEKVAGRIAEARAWFNRRSLPVVFVNDNFDRWNASFSELAAWAGREGSRGRAIVERLRPAPEDYFILKPKHSAFYETALPSLLQKLGARRLVITGIAGDSCVLSSAMDAHIRDFDVWVPADASASLTAERNDRAMQFMAESLGCDITPLGASLEPA